MVCGQRGAGVGFIALLSTAQRASRGRCIWRAGRARGDSRLPRGAKINPALPLLPRQSRPLSFARARRTHGAKPQEPNLSLTPCSMAGHDGARAFKLVPKAPNALTAARKTRSPFRARARAREAAAGVRPPRRHKHHCAHRKVELETRFKGEDRVVKSREGRGGTPPLQKKAPGAHKRKGRRRKTKTTSSRVFSLIGLAGI